MEVSSSGTCAQKNSTIGQRETVSTDHKGQTLYTESKIKCCIANFLNFLYFNSFYYDLFNFIHFLRNT